MDLMQSIFEKAKANPMRVAFSEADDEIMMQAAAQVATDGIAHSVLVGVKLVQQFAGADAYDPMLQGFRKIVCDCSRGAGVSEIVGNVAMSCVRAQALKEA